MPDPDYLPAEESLERHRSSGWSCGEAKFTNPDGRYIHQADGTNGENKIRVDGVTPAEAWYRAVETFWFAATN
jgi:hypothetical protein